MFWQFSTPPAILIKCSNILPFFCFVYRYDDSSTSNRSAPVGLPGQNCFTPVREGNFGHHALTSSFRKYKFLQVKQWFCNNFEWTVSFGIISPFEWEIIIFVACLQHLQSA